MNKEKNNTKVGILTLPLKGNYGGVLQAFALLTFLKNKGYNAYLVDRQWDARRKKTIVYYFQKYFFHNYIIKNVKKFCDKWIQPRTYKIDTQEKMDAINKEGFDAFIVGSDQVWRVEHIGGIKNNFFLDFVKDNNVKKLSYAASFGKDTVDGSKEKLAEISKLMKEFDGISVRENSGIKLCKEVFDVDAIQVLDPTLLLNAKDYLPIIEKKYQKRLTKCLTVYVLDTKKEKWDIIRNVAQKLGLEINSINYKKNPSLIIKNRGLDFYNYVYPPMSNWLRGFRDADFIVTDSFHGMLFSVIFKKQFLIIGNVKRGLARFNSFLKMLNLEHRLITENTKDYLDTIENNIDFEKVYEILEQERYKSEMFLNNKLS